MKNPVKILVYAGLTLVAVFLLSLPLGLFDAQGEIPTVQVLCNAFFACGVLEGGVGLLSWAASQGAFDIFSYAAKVIIYKFKPKEKLPNYYDYTHRNEKSRKAWLKGLTICGGVCVAIALVLLLLL